MSFGLHMDQGFRSVYLRGISVIHLLLLVVLQTANVRAQPSSARSTVQYLSPLPNATRVSQDTGLILRFSTADPYSIQNFDSFLSVEGKLSGGVEGNLSIASDKRTIIFKPTAPFMSGEVVSVRIRPSIAGRQTIVDTTYSFRISKDIAGEATTRQARPSATQASTQLQTRKKSDTGDPVVMNGVSIPADFPYMEVLNSSDPSPGYIFLNNWGGQPYNMILDNTGAPVWYRRTPDRRRDFKVQPNGWLTMLVRGGFAGGDGYIALDSTYAQVSTMTATNGYVTDEHELTMLPDGGYFLIGRREEQVDMSQYVVGGHPDATVSETVIQEYSQHGELIFQWRSWDYFDIQDVQIEDLRGGYIRFPHINAISIDDDGNILISSRHLNEVTKILRASGRIIWRLGGAHNQFRWIDDPLNGFTAQHDIRALGNNRYTIFDNGNAHTPQETRVVEYEIDPVNMTARLVWQYRHSPVLYSYWMGNAQRLANGNTLINYADGLFPKVLEVRPDGTTALEMDFVNPAHSYRVFKFEWEGVAAQPYLIVESSAEGLTLLFNKFGDSDVDHYRIYAGPNASPTDLVAVSEEPFVLLTDLTNGVRYYFRVTAVNSAGVESPASNEESALVNVIAPGTNMILNGDFSSGLANWDFEVSGGAQSSVSTSATGGIRFAIANGGSQYWNVQYRQGGLSLINGQEYRFEFDAYAQRSKLFEAKITEDGGSFTNYSRLGPTSLSTQPKHFSYEFTMRDPTDFAARVVLNAGRSDADLYIDNLSLKQIADITSFEEEKPFVELTRLHQNYPNPFYGVTHIHFETAIPGPVQLSVIDLLGRNVRILVDEMRIAGSHNVSFDATDLPAGVYFYRLSTGEARSSTGQMIYIK